VRLVIQPYDDISTGYQECNQETIINPHTLENEEKLKDPVKEQGMGRVGIQDNIPCNLVNILKRIGILSLIE
jgi:hypothetical protein